MEPQASAKLLGWGRFAIGVGMLAAPGLATRGWIGADADRTGTQVVTRAFGAREALLGFIQAHVASRPGVGARTVQALAVCDAIDAVISLAARRQLPPSGVAMITAVAGSAAISGTLTARRLPQV
ncbi:MAG TPA: hypothetical protein VD931_00980 [Baekduia sp.]|nr:hypothetical protein [Baekduia sp.]